jgi:hypothetical protein
MSEPLQEFVDSGDQRLRVDRAAGIIRGVKLLGLASRNGRRYREGALTDAVSLYEGAKVNINHPKGHPLSPRDYQDRLGVVRAVHYRSGEGLFGDLYFNPKHALSEQLIWDAEHAPQNVGMSHNVLARTSLDGGNTVVEAITKVQSIDLVADPATTSGLYEHAGKSGEVEERSSGVVEGTASAATPLPHYSSTPLSSSAPLSSATPLASLTLAELRQHRPDLLSEATRIVDEELQHARRQLDERVANERASQRRERVVQLLQEHGLPVPTRNDPLSRIVSEEFFKTLLTVADERSVEQMIKERAELVRSASLWLGNRRPVDRRPRSKDQVQLTVDFASDAVHSGQEFANAVRGR